MMALVMMDKTALGRNLKYLLKELGMSQSEFADRTELTQAAISQIIDGKREPSLESILRILAVLPVKFERLFQ